MGTDHYPETTDVAHYEATRYATRDQKFISRREQEMIVAIVRELPAPRKRVLDAPCGYGRFSGHLVGLGVEPVNSDIATTMLARTTTRLRDQGIPTVGVTGDLMRGLPFAPDTFDGALSVRMLHNVTDSDDRTAVLRSFAAVVKDWVVITYYADPVLHTLQFRFRKSFKPKARQTMAMISPAQFRAEAESAGFRVERLVSVLPVLHAQTIAVLRK